MYPLYAVYLLIALATTVTYIDTVFFFQNIEVNRTKSQMDYAVNAASDAAVIRLQDTSQITPTGNIHVDPDHIWDTYKYTFLRSNNIWSEHNMEAVEASFPAVVVTVNDGYYMRMLVDEETEIGANKNYRFAQKIPYARTTLVPTYTTGDENKTTPNLIPTGSVVSDTLDGTNITVYREGNNVLGNKREYEVYQVDGNKLKTNPGSAHDVRDINKMILQSLDYLMFYNSSQSKKHEQGVLSIPDEVSNDLSSPSVNFVGPTVFAFSDNFNLKGKDFLNYFSVGASQMVDATNYYCYIRDGVKYYSRINPQSLAGIQGNQMTGNDVDQIYRTAREAAEAGYEPDPLFY